LVYGFIGNILNINLTNNNYNVEKINIDYTEHFLGGAGYACRYLIEKITKKTDPLGPENILMIMTGPLCGTAVPSSSRFVVCAKSPYTQLWGESNCGGYFGPELKNAGFDGMIIRGKANEPVYIKINKKEVEIITDKTLWGKSIRKTQEILKNDFSKLKVKTLCIGQGGENLVKFATINADGKNAGRTGMGAVMGSKKLKAIIVKGDKSKPRIKAPEGFKEAVKKALKFLLNTETIDIMRSYGTSAGIMGTYAVGDLPIKYWSEGEWEDVLDISGDKYKEDLLVKNRSCYGCPIACGRIIEIKTEEYEAKGVEGPEYETLAGFGSLILNNNLESIAIANDLCNNYGIDTISTSSTIGLLFKLYNEGRLDKNDLDGLGLEWGNHEGLVPLIKKIAFREGIGDLLAEGSDVVGERFNISQDEIATINKLEVPYHDIRSCYGMALTYLYSPRGACHTTADAYKALRKSNEIDFTSIEVEKTAVHSNSKELVKSTANLQNYRALYSSLISCIFFNPPPQYMAEILNSLFGHEYDLHDIQNLGERIFTLKRLFNLKMGLTPNDETIPQILLTPKREGVVRGKAPDYRKLKRIYYDFRTWNPNSGAPKVNKLKELDLDKIDF
jgi:aldehyde:ferredoxin oxidoreductase